MKSKLTPFDAETILMVRNVIKAKPEVIENAITYAIGIPKSKINKQEIEALKKAVSGRLGERLIRTTDLPDALLFQIRYDYRYSELPEEYRLDLSEPIKEAGKRYYRKFEVYAVQVRRDNLEQLQKFTGGGMMRIPREKDAVALYSFPNENGIIVDAPENWMIVLMPGGRFERMELSVFLANFDPIYSPLNAKMLDKMNELYGTDIRARFSKLTEEYNELLVAADNMLVNNIMPDNDEKEEIIDELADMTAVLFHISGLMGYPQNELLKMAFNKIMRRQKDPNYMRKHPHEKVKSHVCGNCNKFENEDVEGDGYCTEQNRMRHCSCLACNKWRDKPNV